MNELRPLPKRGSLDFLIEGHQQTEQNGTPESERRNGHRAVTFSDRPSLEQPQPHAQPESLYAMTSHRSLSSSQSGVMRLMPLLDTRMISATKLGRFLDFIDPFIVLLIFINSIMIGIGTLDFVEKDPSVNAAFDIIDKVFLIIFTAEVTLASVHYLRLDQLEFDGYKLPIMGPLSPQERRARNVNRSWLMFDLTVIIFSWAFSKGSIVRAFRVLRALRLVSKVKSLKNLTRALLHVCPKMGALAFITIILFVVMGIMTTLLFRDTYDPDPDIGTSFDYFGRIDYAWLTLFQMMTFDNWHDPAREIMEIYSWSWIIFVPWVFLSGFVITNLIIAIVCESLVKLDQFGVKALHGEEILQDEFSIRERDESVSSTEEKMALRLMQLENALNQLLDTETVILQELEKMKLS